MSVILLRALKAALLQHPDASDLLTQAVHHTTTHPTPIENFAIISTILLDLDNEENLSVALRAVANAVALSSSAPNAEAIVALTTQIIAKTENTEIWTQALRLASLVVGDLQAAPPALVGLCEEIVSSDHSPVPLLTFAVEVRRHFPVSSELSDMLRARLIAAVEAPLAEDTSALILALLHAFDWLDLMIEGDLRRTAEERLVQEHKQLI